MSFRPELTGEGLVDDHFSDAGPWGKISSRDDPGSEGVEESWAYGDGIRCPCDNGGTIGGLDFFGANRRIEWSAGSEACAADPGQGLQAFQRFSQDGILAARAGPGAIRYR